MKYKAIVTDLDGTALDSPGVKVVSDRLTSAVAALEAQGIRVCAATGRGETFAAPVFSSMKLTEPAIISGGTRIVDPVSGEELWNCGLSADQLHAIIGILEGKNYGFLWNDYTEDAYLSGGWPLTDFVDFDTTYFFEICFVPADEAPGLAETITTIEGVTATVVIAQREGMKDLHITNIAATKEHAIKELEKIIDVPKAAIIGIGDGHNDIHLFNAVGYKVAMGNAVPELQEVADEVIGVVAEDGLAVYFEELASTGGER